MNRRDFLSGLFGTAVVASLAPAYVLTEAATQDWQLAVLPIYERSMFELRVYGTTVIKNIDTFPYIANVNLEDFYTH